MEQGNRADDAVLRARCRSCALLKYIGKYKISKVDSKGRREDKERKASSVEVRCQDKGDEEGRIRKGC